jgi:antitoxin VapB
MMETTNVFTSGNSQAVRIPHAMRFTADTVYIQKVGSAIVLLPTDDPWASLNLARALAAPAFPDRPDQQPWRERETIG